MPLFLPFLAVDIHGTVKKSVVEMPSALKRAEIWRGIDEIVVDESVRNSELSQAGE